MIEQNRFESNLLTYNKTHLELTKIMSWWSSLSSIEQARPLRRCPRPPACWCSSAAESRPLFSRARRPSRPPTCSVVRRCRASPTLACRRPQANPQKFASLVRRAERVLIMEAEAIFPGALLVKFREGAKDEGAIDVGALIHDIKESFKDGQIIFKKSWVDKNASFFEQVGRGRAPAALTVAARREPSSSDLRHRN